MQFDFEQAKQLWRERVWAAPEKVDPHDQYDWDSLAVGFAVALGANYEQANEFRRNWNKY
jgi:hypothetical protein